MVPAGIPSNKLYTEPKFDKQAAEIEEESKESEAKDAVSLHCLWLQIFSFAALSSHFLCCLLSQKSADASKQPFGIAEETVVTGWLHELHRLAARLTCRFDSAMAVMN